MSKFNYFLVHEISFGYTDIYSDDFLFVFNRSLQRDLIIQSTTIRGMKPLQNMNGNYKAENRCPHRSKKEYPRFFRETGKETKRRTEGFIERSGDIHV